MRRRKKQKPIRRHHGMRNSAEWTSWQGMKKRCGNPRHEVFRYYGARGIKVCNRWIYGAHGRSGFQLFFLDMGRKPSPAHTLDRIDNDGNYTPGNCRWATILEQNRNRRGVKLSPAKARHIRKGNATNKMLAIKYGCSRGAIWRARIGLTWREVRRF